MQGRMLFENKILKKNLVLVKKKTSVVLVTW